MLNDFGIKDAMERTKESFTQTEHIIYEYLMENFNDIGNLTIHKLAEVTQTSPSAISRFSKKIGVENFQALKVGMSAEKTNQAFVDPETFLEISEPSEMRTELMRASLQAMNDTLQVISDDDLQEIAKMIRSKNIIYTSGVGLSRLAADNIYQKWSRVGKTVFVVTDKNIAMASMKMLKGDALFWGVSNSGNSIDVTQLMRVAKENNITTLGLTQFASSKIVSTADYLLFTGKLSNKPSALTNSIYAQFMAIDLLYFAYISQEEDKEKIISGENFLDF